LYEEIEIWGDRYAVKALGEISRAYGERLAGLVDHAAGYKASVETLHKRFYRMHV